MRILIVTSGTGGHFYPALCVAELFKKLHPESKISFWSQGTLLKNTKLEGIEKKEIPSYPFVGMTKIVQFLSIIKTIFLSLKLIPEMIKFKPDCLISFGGHTSVAPCISAYMLGIPILSHEQNYKLGLTNYLVSRFAKFIMTSFPEADPKLPESKVIFTGLPVRENIGEVKIEEAEKRLGFKKLERTILCFGGSQGSEAINKTVWALLPMLDEKYLVIHITGEQFVPQIRDLKCQYVNFKYFKEMSLLYALSDLVISRSGASTVFEIIKTGKRAILIPYPGAKSHQKYNALYLEKLGLGKVIFQNALSENLLYNMIREIFELNNKSINVNYDELLKLQKIDATKNIVDLVEKIIERKMIIS
ncbi:UDP-N-acetylglucosamine--N-acetylmuramyl- (pentapeptide) pyrophosphoryl-undecaprenol N-acetylglucosamine transferase [Thermodesulfobium narugense DSM 14796]|uniref:UDP-N-acetylglucosamine--N-acetylmuramyl-(pentapeptide) pyrophosphoryl-undecaprenol N-acetylglucosamine transferase n=1 Tax=Thermodesulfobium narugense DSM 14796 TaxID=747365 RepID=M1E736_9BACT|nr:UDP-N-acetylglucosamine--N-acetylmuramyl-(pentapeptide) pyrophosphoryl-undecaprenol N-acetylglucosamine transferase [Thermodesulfobium narugense]AEE14300.1 UDP-N-acetylglucosamine--N-acetylmuramyl- (pentapeptide) pyrophosphoryl-undecaprenol N-acetylglucosamine transferase [Thermodesulfobium narugense DSM 14796]